MIRASVVALGIALDLSCAAGAGPDPAAGEGDGRLFKRDGGALREELSRDEFGLGGFAEEVASALGPIGGTGVGLTVAHWATAFSAWMAASIVGKGRGAWIASDDERRQPG